ncbi:MAG: PBP1A family penicillin-binding protein [Bdellovibrionota bacterium]
MSSDNENKPSSRWNEPILKNYEWAKNIKRKYVAIGAGATLVIITSLFISWILALNSQIDTQLQKKRFSPPLEFYSAPIKYFKGVRASPSEIIDALKTAGFRQREASQALAEHDYSLWPKELCEERLRDMEDGVEKCIVLKKSSGTHTIALSAENIIIDVYDVDSTAITLTELEPVLFAQFYGKEPIMRSMVQLGDAPPICLNALLAIEDQKFLEHQGISVIGIARAFLRNTVSGKVVQGGSTITQQLVKNYFLTHERTFSRKFKEVFMALLIETKSSKDDILEAYINEIYMGQNGSFQIRGFGAAAEYYFGKPLTELDLPECSLLAAIVNSPGLFNPFRNPENAFERRQKVLTKLLEEKTISEEEMTTASAAPLPKAPQKVLSEPAPYFVDAVMRELEDAGVDGTFGLKIETTLNLKAQEAAQRAVKMGIENLEKNNKIVKELKEKNKKVLEGLLISADPTNGHIQAIVGGRSFKVSQYNRAIQSRRQVGSIIKPFVFLSALESVDDAGEPYQPLTLLNDEKFKMKYEGQEWSPKNYGGKYYGQIPMYFALKSSLNTATASLGVKIGLANIIDAARAAGIESPMKAFPALTLGVFELPALEVLQAYSTLARLGEKTKLTMIRKIKSLEDEVIFEHVIEKDQTIEKDDAAILVGMMKQTIISGTAVGARLSGFTHPAAGKTGTTNDFKDAWFAGFTPLHVAVAWVGYDDNTSAKLTGSSGGVPIWTQYMKEYASYLPAVDFELPEDTETREISVEDQKAMNVPEDEKRPLEPIQLIFKD